MVACPWSSGNPSDGRLNQQVDDLERPEAELESDWDQPESEQDSKPGSVPESNWAPGQVLEEVMVVVVHTEPGAKVVLVLEVLVVVRAPKVLEVVHHNREDDHPSKYLHRKSLECCPGRLCDCEARIPPTSRQYAPLGSPP